MRSIHFWGLREKISTSAKTVKVPMCSDQLAVRKNTGQAFSKMIWKLSIVSEQMCIMGVILFARVNKRTILTFLHLNKIYLFRDLYQWGAPTHWSLPCKITAGREWNYLFCKMAFGTKSLFVFKAYLFLKTYLFFSKSRKKCDAGRETRNQLQPA